MPHIVPSEVVSAIDQLFPDAVREGQGQVPNRYNISHAPRFAALLELVERIPSELHVIESSEYAALMANIAAIRAALAIWPTQGGSFLPEPLPGSKLSPAARIRAVLANCPDECPSATTTELAFILDSASLSANEGETVG